MANIEFTNSERLYQTILALCETIQLNVEEKEKYYQEKNYLSSNMSLLKMLLGALGEHIGE